MSRRWHYTVASSVNEFSFLARHLQEPSMLLSASAVHPFNMEHYSTICLLTLLLINTGIISSRTILHNAAMHILLQDLLGQILAFISGKHPEVKLHGHRVNVCFTLHEMDKSFKSNYTTLFCLSNV